MTSHNDQRPAEAARDAEMARLRAEEQRGAGRTATAGDYEREAELTRRRLADHLDELSDRLTPGQVFDEVLSYSRVGGGTVFRAFTNAMRENPLPSLLIGAGCMMFLSEQLGLRGNGTKQSAAAAERYAADPYAADPYADAEARGYGVPGAAPRAPYSPYEDRRTPEAAARMSAAAASGARSAASSVRSGVRSAAGAASRQTSNAAGAVADTMRQTTGAVADTMRQTSDAVADTVRQTTDAVGDTMRQTSDMVGGAAAGAADAVRGTTRDVLDRASATTEQLRRGAQNVAGTVRDTAASMGGAFVDTASSMSGALADKASTMSGVLADRASTMSSALADTASSVGGVLADTADRTRRQAAEAVRQSGDSAASLVKEQPLLAAAIGIALGAALASFLPRTETEDELMGEASDAVKGTATQAGSEALESAKAMASTVVDKAQTAVMEAAQEQGLTPDALSEAARNIGQGIREGAQGAAGEAVRKAGEGIRQGAQSAMKEPMTGTGPQQGASGPGRS